VLVARRDWTAIAALAALSLLPVLPTLHRLGLTSDDYGIFIGFEQLRDAPWPRVLAFIFDDYATRPAQGLASGLLYYAFGLEPLPYVLVLLALVAASVVLFWSLLLRLRVEPAVAFAAAAVFAVLPQLSTVRVWFSTLCVAAAMMLFLAGAHSLLTWLRGRRLSSAVAVSLLWALCMAFYELFIPLMAGALAYAWWRDSDHDVRGRGLAAARPLLPHVLLIVGGVAAKVAFTDRTDGWYPKFIAYQALRPGYDRETEFGFNFWAFAETHAFDTFALPLRSLDFFAEQQFLPHLAAGVAAGAIIFLGTVRFGWRLERASALKAVAAGVLVSALGYGIFVLNASTSFTPAGIGNRTAVASAMGIAIVIAASVLALAAKALPRANRAAGGVALALLGLLLTLASARISEHWARAYETQQAVLAHVEQDLGWLKPASIVLLDGVCPYDGPGIVFETDWDVAGAMSLVLKRPVAGNLIGRGMRFGRRGAVATIYSNSYSYPYGLNTYAYDVRTRTTTRLADWEAARRYLRQRRPRTCPRGYPGHGVPI
jgi:hypothetical protein